MAELHSSFVVATVAIRMKRHTANVGPKDISDRNDRWSRRADKLLFVRTPDYTAGAREVAEEPDKRVTLVNGRSSSTSCLSTAWASGSVLWLRSR